MKLIGIVEVGAGIGKSEFVPTMNLLLEDAPKELDFGIYACTTQVDDVLYKGVMHYGPRSSIDNLITCEVNLFDFNQQVYGKTVEVFVGVKIRDIIKFNSREELQNRIMKDIEIAKNL